MTKTQKQLKTEIVQTGACKPNPWNPNRMNRKEFEALKLSIKEHGQTKPIQVRKLGKEYQILGGFHTWSAMKELGHKEIAVNIHELDDDGAKLYSLQDNLGGQDDLLKLGMLVYELTQKGHTIEKIARVYGAEEEMLKDALCIAQEEADKMMKKLNEEVNRPHMVEVSFIVDEDPKERIGQFVKDVTAFAKAHGASVIETKEKINPKKVTVSLITFSVTAPQAIVINEAIDSLAKSEKATRSRALELMCADWLAGK